MPAGQIHKPFTDDQVDSLNEYQTSDVCHPFTCGGEACRNVLVATNDGWTCPSCDYTQDWAHEFMGNWAWFQHMILGGVPSWIGE